jgi:hypothetical protein
VIARAYTIAREVFAMRTLWVDIEALDNRVPADVQYGMFYPRQRACCATPATGCCATATQAAHRDAVRELRTGVQALDDSIDGTRPAARASSTTRCSPSSTGSGVPEKLARAIARLRCWNRRWTSWRWRAARRAPVATWRAPTSNSASRWARLAAHGDRPAHGRRLLAGHGAHRAARCRRCARIANSRSRC